MGLPSEDRPPGTVNGTFYDDHAAAPQDPAQAANGQSPLPYRNMESSARRDREGGAAGDALGEPRERTKGTGSRRPSGQQRICGKCQQHLTGQFVRALGDTYHLECFTCHVRTNSPIPSSYPGLS
jgi:hypothetical protein